MTDQHLHQKAQKVVHGLLDKASVLVTAESCTGGWVSAVITGVHGASAVFDRGYVAYSNEAKTEVLAVDRDLLARYGAVSPEVVEAMAKGALASSNADIALAITGIAGPGGGSIHKPVGMVYHCCQRRGEIPLLVRNIFNGDRATVRRQSVNKGLDMLLSLIA